jgi:hypothetical protein
MTFSSKQSASDKQTDSSSQSETDAGIHAAPEVNANAALPLYSRNQATLRLSREPASLTPAGAPSESVVGQAGEANEPALAGPDAETHDAPPVASNAEEGQPLEAGIRNPLERFYEHPLDQVRVFSGPESRQAAESHGAYALTSGRNIHLGARGQALPANQRKALLAHEAAHTLQQGDSAPVTQLSAVTPDAENSPAEQQAEGLSHAFMAHESGHSAGLAVRDSIGLRPRAAGGVQLARFPTHFGEFEDYKFNEVKDASTGTSLGVQLHLKFHPGENVDAKKIGLTQAAEGKEGGAQVNEGFYGRRQATSGAGVGYFIDRVEGRPSPLYGTSDTATPGADTTKLGAFPAPGVRTLNATEKASTGLTGIDYGGGSKFGFRFTEGNVLKGPEPAELADAPVLGSTANSSEQLFETTALAFEGTMAGTYLGSVEWGWRRDAAGKFSSVPVSVKSMGTPSANFLTAANIWNSSKENFTRIANVNPTNILQTDAKNNLKTAFTVAQGTPMRETASGTAGGNTFYRIDLLDGSGRSGFFVLSTDTTQVDAGRETVDLPVPEIYTVNVPGGMVLDGETRCSPSDPTLPQGTRVQSLGPYTGVPGYLRVQVADGPLTGRRGIMRQSALTREALGTH